MRQRATAHYTDPVTRILIYLMSRNAFGCVTGQLLCVRSSLSPSSAFSHEGRDAPDGIPAAGTISSNRSFGGGDCEGSLHCSVGIDFPLRFHGPRYLKVIDRTWCSSPRL